MNTPFKSNIVSHDAFPIEYYRQDGGADAFYYCCLDRYYIFRATRSAPHWEFLRPESALWDAIHQSIYRNHRCDAIAPDRLPTDLPRPPQSIPHLAPVVPPPCLAADYPAVARHLARCDGHTQAVFLVLFEDSYESACGDGEFHYPQAVFFDGADAARYMRASATPAMKYHLRQGAITLCDGVLASSLHPETFDRFNAQQVFALCNERLARSKGFLAWLCSLLRRR